MSDMNANLQGLVRALRSGEIKQGVGHLRDRNDCYCIWGVACEGYRQVTGQGEWVMNTDMIMENCYYFIHNGECDDVGPLDAVVDFYGFPEFHEYADDIVEFLMQANDNEKLSFDQLADKIEEICERASGS